VYIVIVVIDGYASTPSKPITLGDGATADNINFTVKGDGSITPDGITGTEDQFAFDIKIYPNPFTDRNRGNRGNGEIGEKCDPTDH
jgi:hypothetical protein